MVKQMYKLLCLSVLFASLATLLHSCVGTEQRYSVQKNNSRYDNDYDRRRREDEERRRREEEERKRREEERRRLHSEAEYYVRRIALTFAQQVMADVNPKTSREPNYKQLDRIDVDEDNYTYRTKVVLTWQGRSDRALAEYGDCEVDGDLIIYLRRNSAEFIPKGHNHKLKSIFSYYDTHLKPFYEFDWNK